LRIAIDLTRYQRR